MTIERILIDDFKRAGKESFLATMEQDDGIGVTKSFPSLEAIRVYREKHCPEAEVMYIGTYSFDIYNEIKRWK